MGVVQVAIKESTKFKRQRRMANRRIICSFDTQQGSTTLMRWF
jgi:hypothetical protein